MELAKNLNKHCKVKGLSLTALARLSGVKQPTLHGWTTGRSVHKLDDFKRVCEFLKLACMKFSTGDATHFTRKMSLKNSSGASHRITPSKI